MSLATRKARIYKNVRNQMEKKALKTYKNAWKHFDTGKI